MADFAPLKKGIEVSKMLNKLAFAVLFFAHGVFAIPIIIFGTLASLLLDASPNKE